MLHRFESWATTPQSPLLPLSRMAAVMAFMSALAGFIPLWGGFFIAFSTPLIAMSAGPAWIFGVVVAVINVVNLQFFSKLYKLAAFSGLKQGNYEMMTIYAGLFLAQLLALLALFLLQRRLKQMAIWPRA
ncbi:hypothetical protein [Magnetococcus sp. PR-3]|uniref:hypothetical protein n=1 Tax=Magnetococcus sp. PR-3 TaxID=3120355 RepID=UPI002FCE2062